VISFTEELLHLPIILVTILAVCVLNFPYIESFFYELGVANEYMTILVSS
jgi:hypothetical protein